MKLIGITGGVGSGKSQVLSFIEEHYLCRIYLADEVAHIVQQKGQICYEEIVQLLGRDILGADGEIDRKKMAAKIFSDEALLEKVNEIVHPRVEEFIRGKIDEAEEEGDVELFFIEAALLIEAGYSHIVNEMWYIYTREDVRRSRLKESRGYSDEKISQIMSNQLSEEEFRKHCDFVIDNSGTLEDTHLAIKQRLEEYTWLR
ncbi:MAG: dephospho-CoA kinase [Lachnospiraceae bacterium]|nr:dephospho-CoA kinase [Lachnospiraceae bacterium]